MRWTLTLSPLWVVLLLASTDVSTFAFHWYCISCVILSVSSLLVCLALVHPLPLCPVPLPLWPFGLMWWIYLTDGPVQRNDDLTGGSGRVLQADVAIDGDLACRIYDSCKSVAIVGETTAMQSGLVRRFVLPVPFEWISW